jgi:hypothetical protein
LIFRPHDGPQAPAYRDGADRPRASAEEKARRRMMMIVVVGHVGIVIDNVAEIGTVMVIVMFAPGASFFKLLFSAPPVRP